MNKLILIFLVFNSMLLSNEAIINSLKVEITDKNQFEKEKKIYLNHLPILRNIANKKQKLYQNVINRNSYLKALAEIKKNSIIIDSIIAQEYMLYADLKDQKLFEKYLLNSVKRLYKHQICIGYILLGEYYQNIQMDTTVAMSIYSEGAINCKLMHRKNALKSRKNQILYGNKK